MMQTLLKTADEKKKKKIVFSDEIIKMCFLYLFCMVQDINMVTQIIITQKTTWTIINSYLIF